MFFAGRAARHPVGDASAEEPAAAGGKQCPEGESSQLREVTVTEKQTFNECYLFQTVMLDLCVFGCRRLEDLKGENREMSQAVTSKEASIRSIQQQLEEKTHECSVLSRQLQQTLDDVQKQVWKLWSH